MSEMSKAYIAVKRRLREELDVDQLMLAKTYFKAGWEAREILINKRIAEIEKAATLKERKRCAIICDNNGLNSSSPSNFADNCAAEIRRGQ
jgi:hypothetical protein